MVLPTKGMRMPLLHLWRSSERDADAKGDEMRDRVNNVPGVALVADVQPKGHAALEPNVYATSDVVAACVTRRSAAGYGIAAVASGSEGLDPAACHWEAIDQVERP